MLENGSIELLKQQKEIWWGDKKGQRLGLIELNKAATTEQVIKIYSIHTKAMLANLKIIYSYNFLLA